MKGTIKWYNFKKGYGFIKGEDDQDYFVHYTQVPKDARLKEEMVAIDFDLELDL